MANRLDMFRQYMARLDVSADPQVAIDGGYYVEPPGRAIAYELAARLELKPSSTHIVLGGVGAGKTTQLILLVEKLNGVPDTLAVYVDTSEYLDLRTPQDGGLDRAVIEALKKEHTKRLSTSIKLDWEAIGRNMARALVASSSNNALVAQLREEKRHIIIVLDALDRITSVERFTELVMHDLPALRGYDLGVVLTAPLHTLYGTARAVLDQVDRYYHLPTVSPYDDEQGLEFLVSILRARLPESVCDDAVCRNLAELSGGVLRDMIALAQATLEEAYVHGADAMQAEHAFIAADAFGRRHILGLNLEEIGILWRVRNTGSFIPITDRDLALLHTRRVLEYTSPKLGSRYAVHPTIAPLVEQLIGTP